jgi:hypothetical protein
MVCVVIPVRSGDADAISVSGVLGAEDKVAQLLMPTLEAYDYHREAVDAFLTERTLGGIFVGMGVAGYAKRRERTVACITAGCDMLLFPKLPDDYATLLEAVRSGALPEARLDEAVRRISAFKASVNLHTGALFDPADTAQEQQVFATASRQIAAAAIVKVRDLHGTQPIRHLQPGARVLTITLASDSQDVPEVDNALRERGYHVDHVYNPDDLRLSDQTFAYDAVFVNFVFKGWAARRVCRQ